ncbi:MAG: regulatory iron-sulfur-containing complex subunit RicT [Candidatus Edwardsbacteria bacterium]
MSEKVEVLLRGTKKGVYLNERQLPLKISDYVIVAEENEEEIGRVIGKAGLVERKNLSGEIIRKATKEDLIKIQQNQAKEEEAFRVCLERIQLRELPMSLVEVEARFSGDKLIFYFTADKRIDFRGLVKDLAAVFKMRIEMRQIGMRDEAKRLGGYGPCGRPLCCATFLKEFEPVTFKMGKEQNLSLTSAKMLGVCGRLMCCLMYEEEIYREELKKFPRIGTTVNTERGEATVEKIDIFHQNIFVKYEDGTEGKISLEEFKK